MFTKFDVFNSLKMQSNLSNKLGKININETIKANQSKSSDYYCKAIVVF